MVQAETMGLMVHIGIVTTMVYGALVLLGGVFGYLKAKSKPSLIMGSSFGIALILVAVLEKMRVISQGLEIALGISVFLLVFFGIRYLRKKKFMPAGMLTSLSLITLLVNILAMFARQS